MGFGVSVEIDCGKTNATAATIIRRSLAAIPMRTEVHRVTAAHPGIWSSIGADTETSKEASKTETATSISLLAPTPTRSLKRLILIGGKNYNTRRNVGPNTK
jgi:hypothetical protein